MKQINVKLVKKEIKVRIDTRVQPVVVKALSGNLQTIRVKVDSVSTPTIFPANYMIKNVYDSNNNGIVDNSEKLEGFEASELRDRETHTGTQPISTITGVNVAVEGIVNPLIENAIQEHLEALNPHEQYLLEVDAFTQAIADTIYQTLENAFTQEDADSLYQPLGPYLTQTTADLRYLQIEDAFTKTEADTLYLPIDTDISGGDMYKAVYDTTGNGIVDNSEKVGGFTAAELRDRSTHTGSQTASTISNFNTAADSRVAAGITALKGETDPFTQYQLESAAFTQAIADTLYQPIGPYLDDTDAIAINDAIEAVAADLTAHEVATDPHTQYFNTTRGDARYRKLTDPVDAATLQGSTLAQVEARANHTGTQTASTISDFNSTANSLIDTKITEIKKGTLWVNFDGLGDTLIVGSQDILVVPSNCTILSAVMLSKEVGNIVIDIWKDTYSNYPPDSADKITASAPPTITGTNRSTDSTLTGWNKTLTAGTVLKFNINSCSTITKCSLVLNILKD